MISVAVLNLLNRAYGRGATGLRAACIGANLVISVFAFTSAIVSNASAGQSLLVFVILAPIVALSIWPGALRGLLVAMLGTLSISFPHQAQQFGSGEDHRLQPGSSPVAELQPGRPDRWRVNLESGDFFELVTFNTTLDLVLRMVRPDSTVYATVDLTAPPDPEVLIGIADAGGSWTLEVQGLDASAGGPYTIWWKERRVPKAGDRLAVSAQSLWLLALDKQAGGDTQSALELMQQSIKELEQAKVNTPTLIARLDYLAGVLVQNGDLQSAEKVARQALERLERIASPDGLRLASVREKLALALGGQQRLEEATALLQQNVQTLQNLASVQPEVLAEAHGSLGGFLYQQARYREAAGALEQAAAVLKKREQPADPLLAMVLNNLAAVQETLEDFTQAETTYREALQARESLFGPNHEEVAITLNNLAFLYERQGRYDEAAAMLQRSAAILEERLGPQDPQFGLALNNLAGIHKNRGHYDDAERMYLRVEEIFRHSHGERHQDFAGVQGNLGNLYVLQGRYSEAEPQLRAALDTLQELLGDHPLTANALGNLGELYRHEGRYDAAERLFRRSLSIYEQVFSPTAIETFGPRNNLASQYVEQGRFAEAESVFSQLVRLAESALGPEHPFLAKTWNNLGNVYLEQGRNQEAESAFADARSIWRANFGERHFEVAIATHNLARLYFRTQRLEEAGREMDQALEIRRAVFPENHLDIANSLNLRADFNLGRSNLTAALEDYRTSLGITRSTLGPEHPLVGVAEGHLGRALIEAGDLDHARVGLRESIRLLSQGGSYPESLIRSYSALARLEKKVGNRPEAIRLMTSALEHAERLRPQVGGGELTRAEFLERVGKEFQLMVQWQVESGDVDAAFEFAERSRARALLDQLALSGVDLRSSLPADVRDDLIERELRARAAVAELQQRIRVLKSRDDLDSVALTAQAQVLQERLRSADRGYQRAYEELRSSSPVWTRLITAGGDTVSLNKVRQDLVKEGTALLMYQIGEQASYLFLIRHGDTSPAVFPLQVGPEAELAGLSAGPLTRAGLARLLRAEQDMMGSISRLSQFPRLSLLLAQVLVPPQAWLQIEGLREIILIPHGILHFLPFDMLVLKLSEGDEDPDYWLDKGPVIRYASSATTLLNLQRRETRSDGGILSLSDPTFRMATGENSKAVSDAAPPAPNTTSRGIMGTPLVELPGSRRETERIRNAFPNTVVLQKERATELNLRAAVPGRNYIHLATHGLVDEGRNNLFSALALTNPATETMNSSDDGLLQLYEIYDLDLSSAELAVLSACQTNVGNHVNGDGVFGLSRGFLAAGAKRVIASQWRVDDDSTAELIGTFFEKLAAVRRSGEAIDYAWLLHQAKQSVRQQPRWSEPHFWAPFILVGAR